MHAYERSLRSSFGAWTTVGSSPTPVDYWQFTINRFGLLNAEAFPFGFADGPFWPYQPLFKTDQFHLE
jgi:hypothetical protein